MSWLTQVHTGPDAQIIDLPHYPVKLFQPFLKQNLWVCNIKPILLQHIWCSFFISLGTGDERTRWLNCWIIIRGNFKLIGIFFFSHPLSMVGLRPSSSLSTGCVVVSLRGDWAIFYHPGSGRVGRVWSAREKSLEILRRGWELNPDHRKDRQWAIPLSYHDWLGITVV